MSTPHVLVADWLMPDFDVESDRFEQADVSFPLPSWRPPQPAPDVQYRELVQRIQSAPRIDAVLFQLAPLDRDVIDLVPDTCRIFQRMGIGLDTIDRQRATERGIPVRNTPAYCTEEVAVHSLAMLLSLHRQLDDTQRRLLAGEWSDRAPRPIDRLSNLTLGLVGLGNDSPN